jgi:hypothetical protein
MRLFAVALPSALLSACGGPPGPREHMAERHTLMIVSGSDESLSAFEIEARRCGVAVVSRVPNRQGGTWLRVQGPISTDEVLAQYNCARKWVSDRPAELQLVGDEAGDLWD